MKTKTFLLLCCLFIVKCNRQEEFTMLGEPASVQDKMNGKVQKVVFKLFWGTGTGEDIKKGNHITTRERDSLGWFYDFEATFDNIGDHIINYNTLDDNNNPVNTWQFIKENNLIVLSKWSFRKPVQMGFGAYSTEDGYTKYINNEKGQVIKKEDCRAHNDSLLYSFTLKYNEAGDEIETQAFDGKGNFIRKWSTEYNDKRQVVGYVNYGPDGNIIGSSKRTINDSGKISEATFFDKDKNVTGKAKYTYLEYDAKGNWIRVGYEYGPFTTYGERTISYFE